MASIHEGPTNNTNQEMDDILKHLMAIIDRDKANSQDMMSTMGEYGDDLQSIMSNIESAGYTEDEFFKMLDSELSNKHLPENVVENIPDIKEKMHHYFLLHERAQSNKQNDHEKYE